jgi:hypothetical protein
VSSAVIEGISIGERNMSMTAYDAFNLKERDYSLRMASVWTAVPGPQEPRDLALPADLEAVGEPAKVLDSDHVASALGHCRREGS